jgi:hypothetical protein
MRAQSMPAESHAGHDESERELEARRDRAARRASLRLLTTEADFTWSDPTPPRRSDPVAAPQERRTVVIRGRGAERYPTPRRGYESHLRRHERSGFKPDRVALWAVLLGVALLLAAVTSAHAAGLAPGLLHHLAAR